MVEALLSTLMRPLQPAGVSLSLHCLVPCSIAFYCQSAAVSYRWGRVLQTFRRAFYTHVERVILMYSSIPHFPPQIFPKSKDESPLNLRIAEK